MERIYVRMIWYQENQQINWEFSSKELPANIDLIIIKPFYRCFGKNGQEMYFLVWWFELNCILKAKYKNEGRRPHARQ